MPRETLIQHLKQRYWAALRAWRRWRDPAESVLTPGDWLDAVTDLLAKQDARSEPRVYVDGGAHDGQFAAKVAERLDNVAVYAFEPNAELLPALRQTLRDTPGDVVGAALGSRCGDVELNVNASAMTSSVLPRGEFSRRYFDACTQPRQKRRVPIVTLDEWARQAEISRVDLLKLDLQGYELEALRGATELLARGVGAVFLEVSFVPLYENSPLFADVDLFMREHGYRLMNLYHLATRHADGQLVGGDALYVPQRDGAQILGRSGPARTLRLSA